MDEEFAALHRRSLEDGGEHVADAHGDAAAHGQQCAVKVSKGGKVFDIR